jgi:hypothetical protein
VKFKIKSSFFAFCLGVFLSCAVIGGALLYVGVIEMPLSVLMALQIQPKTFPVHLKVDFGPAGKTAHDEIIQVEKGTTPKQAVSQVFPVLSGKGCCSLKEVIEIGGVKVNPEKEHWWICLVNGSKNISPHRKRLKADDAVEWKYI